MVQMARGRKRNIKLCIEPGCNNQQTTLGYCRICYFKNWKLIKKLETKIDGDVGEYLSKLADKHPDDLDEALREEVGVSLSSDDVPDFEGGFSEYLEGLNTDEGFEEVISTLTFEDT